MRFIKQSQSNCDPALGVVGSDDRCPHCGYFHLRPGYCQALDPRNPNYKAPVHKVDAVNTQPVHKEPAVNTREQSAEEKRKAYRREWMRKKREAEKNA